MPPVIRPAGLADLDPLTDLHCACFGPEDHVPVMLGKDFVRATYRWQLRDPGTYVLVADIDGRLAGLVSVSDRPYTRPMLTACLPQLARSVLRHPGLLARRRLWRRLLRRSREPAAVDERGVAQLANVAVEERFRGQGVFAALARAAQEASRARGARAIRAGVYRANAASRRAFTKAGWVEAPAFETADTVSFVVSLDPDYPHGRDRQEPPAGGAR